MARQKPGIITNNIVSSYLDTLYQNPDPRLEQLRDLAETNHVPVILKDTESFLMMLLKLKEPSHILEIGSAVGYSALCFAMGCNADVTTIEQDEKMYDAAVNNIEQFGLSSRIRVIRGDAAEELSKLDGPFDFVFIDASKSHYREFWDLALPLCSDDALIVCDNVLMKGMTASDEFDTKKRYKTSIRRMREFLHYINGIEYADTSILPVGDGMSVSVIDKHEET